MNELPPVSRFSQSGTSTNRAMSWSGQRRNDRSQRSGGRIRIGRNQNPRKCNTSRLPQSGRPTHAGAFIISKVVSTEKYDGKQYPQLCSKVVNFTEHKFEEGLLCPHFRFMDKTELTFTLGCRLTH